MKKIFNKVILFWVFASLVLFSACSSSDEEGGPGEISCQGQFTSRLDANDNPTDTIDSISTNSLATWYVTCSGLEVREYKYQFAYYNGENQQRLYDSRPGTFDDHSSIILIGGITSLGIPPGTRVRCELFLDDKKVFTEYIRVVP